MHSELSGSWPATAASRVRSAGSPWSALLPIPGGPIDEGVLLIVAGLLWVFYRDCLKDAWSRAA